MKGGDVVEQLSAPSRGLIFSIPLIGLSLLATSIKGFRGLCEGKYDHMPEAAFYIVGTIEEAIEKGKKLAAEAA